MKIMDTKKVKKDIFTVLTSIVQIDECKLLPSSNDIPYFVLGIDEWKNLNLSELKNEYYN